MRITFTGPLPAGVGAKDVILHAIGELGIAAAQGCAVEYAGEPIQAFSVEQRLTLCNMSIEIGARLGLVAPDEATFAYVRGREFAPDGDLLDRAIAAWRQLPTEPGTKFDRDFVVDCRTLAPQVTWGTTQQDVAGIDQRIPDPASYATAQRRELAAAAISYMGLTPGTPMDGIPIDVTFIGSCTNSRLGDLQAAAAVVRGRKVAPNVRALVVPGSMSIKRAAEAEGLHHVFRAAGFEWRDAGCSMCVSINEDLVPPGARCIATSNRNFEHRQGPRSRTHLASPAMAAAAAIAGTITDSRRMMPA
jgi:3-isopropylmalate/(R)-2-methylmalate dehydratase large subunit